MFPYLEKCEPPSNDRRWKIIAATMRKLGNERHALIETLHSLQQAFGYLDKRGLAYVAASLKIPLSKVYGVATFYNLFTMKPPGEHSCIVCTGTACYIKGAPELLRAVAAAEGIEPGETTADGRISLSTARCYGVCGVAPLVVIDDEVIGPVTAEMVQQKLREVAAHGR
jgi:bidirectional [NiFe] hydrogenase diaphorase subunit